MRFKNYILSITSLVIIYSFSSCLSNTKESSHKWHIGVSQCSSGPWRDQQNSEMERELLLHEGATMEILCAEDDINRQVQQIEELINKNVDLLLVSPIESIPLTTIVSKAYSAGIPVVLFDRKIACSDYTAFVGGDNEGAGTILADYVANQIPKGGKVIELTGSMDSTPAQMRHQGFVSGLTNYPETQLIASIDAMWSGEKTKQIIDSLLPIYPEINIIVAHTDFMALAAKEEADSLKPNNNIIFAGIDGLWDQGLISVEEGSLNATVTYATGGHSIIRIALDILEGKPYQKENLLESFLIDNKAEAMLNRNMYKKINADIQTIQTLKEKASHYLDRLNLEKIVNNALFVILILAIVMIISLGWMLKMSRRLAKSMPKPVALVIESNKDTAHMLEKELNSRYQVRVLGNAQEAISHARAHTIHIIMCAHTLPDMTGEECKSLLQNDTLTSHIPVIVLGNKVGMSEISPEVIDTEIREHKTSRLDKMFIDKLNTSIEKNLDDFNFNVEILSSEMCLSRAQLFRKCKALIGESPVEYIRSKRLNRAKELLIEGSTSVSEVATQVGFADASYFSRCFKTYFGITPNDMLSAKRE